MEQEAKRVGVIGSGMGIAPLVAAALKEQEGLTQVVPEPEIDMDAAPVGELVDVVKEEEQDKTAATIALVDRMNREMDKNEDLREFLMGLNNLVRKAGKAIPRKLLLENGVSKKDLNRLTQVGFIREAYLRHNHTGAAYLCVSLPENVTFYGKQAAAVVREPDIKEEVAQGLRGSLGGVENVVSGIDAPVTVERVHVGD